MTGRSRRMKNAISVILLGQDAVKDGRYIKDVDLEEKHPFLAELLKTSGEAFTVKNSWGDPWELKR